jgi:thioredoxin family protein
MDIAGKFDQGVTYRDFLAAHATEEQVRRWSAVHAAIAISDAQRALLTSFTRQMPVLCLAGAWCGDCVNQCPIFEHFERINDKIRVRFLDRDTHPELTAELRICGGARVPVVVFLSEDGYEVGRYGDRTLSKYRDMVRQLSGASCPTGLAAPEQGSLAVVVQDWLDQFERAQWILRTSSRLRQLHGD